PAPAPPPVAAPPAETGSADEAATKAAPKPLPAPTPARLALARRLIEAQGGAQAFSDIFNGGIDGIIAGLKPAPEVLALMAPYRERLAASLKKHMPEMVEATAVAWARVYTEDELNAQLDYMKTPGARGVMSRWPLMARQLGQEFGWFARQAVLTDPKMSKYLADVGNPNEPPLSWPTPPAESMAMIRARVAATPAGVYLDHPEKLADTVTKGKHRTADQKRMDRRMTAIVPIFLHDILVIMANNLSPDDLKSQDAYMASGAGKTQAAKTAQVSASLAVDLKPIIVEIFAEVMKPADKT
ncbi:MAG: hypothetical protein JWP35_3825, partial [Caulobacter sp.]|nr:hypothetical protein [Caulobacter sp.]